MKNILDRQNLLPFQKYACNCKKILGTLSLKPYQLFCKKVGQKTLNFVHTILSLF